MATRLKQIISVVALGAGVTQAFPHGLNWCNRPVVPDICFVNDNDIGSELKVVSATTTTVSILNTGAAAVTAFVLIESWHTIDRAFGASATAALTPQPFVPARGAAGGIDVDEEGVPVVTAATVLDFVGPGVTVTDVAGVATVTLGGGTTSTITVANTPYTILPTDDYLFVNTTGGAITLQLPDPTQFAYAKEYFLVDTNGTFDTNNVTLSPFAGELISGVAANRTFQTPWGGWTIVTNGVDWYVR